MTVSRQHHATNKEFIRAQRLVRIVIPNTHSILPGNGNQAVAKQLTNIFRDLGFEGKFECIYFKGVHEKVATIFGLNSNFYKKPIYYDEINKIRFIEYATYSKHLRDNRVVRCVLSFSNGLFGVDNVYNAEALNSEMNIYIQSYLTSIPEIFPKHGDKIKLDKKCTFFKNNVGSAEEFFKSLASESVEKSILTKKPGLSIFLERFTQNHVNVVFAYGWPLLKGSTIDFPDRILELLLGIHHMIAQGSEELRNKPVILGVFYDYREEITTLKHVFAKYAPEHELSKLGKKIIYAHIEDETSIAQIEQLKPSEMMVLSFGKMSQKYFNYLFMYDAKNVLLRFYEGESTRNALISGPDLPFIQSKTFIPKICADEEGVYPELSKLYYELKKEYKFLLNNIEENGKTIGKFLIDCQNESSEVRKYFNTLFTEANKPENNRLELVLEKAMEVYHQEKPLTSSATQTKSLVTVESFQMIIDAITEDGVDQQNESEQTSTADKETNSHWITRYANKASSWFYELLDGSGYFPSDPNVTIWNHKGYAHSQNKNGLFAAVQPVHAIASNDHAMINSSSQNRYLSG